MAQLSQSGRIVTLLTVSQGSVFVAQPGDSVWTSTINGCAVSPPLAYTGVVYSTQLNQKLWFADGVNYAYYDPSINTVLPWKAAAGTLPVDLRGNLPRLICTWRGRIVLAGLLYDPSNWFMSAVSEPRNFDYAPNFITPTQAVTGTASPMGLVGDVITGLIPYSDDTLIFMGDHSIYQMSGDPMSGGQLDRVSDAIGGAWGICWCKDPYGTIYFVSNRCGIYTLVPGQKPIRISQPIEQLIRNLDTGMTNIRCVWNDEWQGVHFFFTPLLAPESATHLFYEWRTGAWWPDVYGADRMNPLCCVALDGNTITDRVTLIGSWDGYVRAISENAVDDDGTPIPSFVVLGPLNTKNLDELLLKDLQAVLGATSGTVTYQIYTGKTAEQALSSAPFPTNTWLAGRNLSRLIRRSGHAIYVKLSATTPWSMETIRALVAPQGIVRGRGF